MTKNEHDALRAQTVADMHAMSRPRGIDDIRAAVATANVRESMGPDYCPIVISINGQPYIDGLRAEYVADEHRPAAIDEAGVWWLLDGSGDVA